MLRGSSQATIDAKGRLKIPADFRRTIEERWGPELFITSIRGESALIYPLPEWERKEDQLSTAPSMRRQVEKLVARLSYYGQQVSMDGQGRALIPQILRDVAQMEGEVVVLGKIKTLEVWNREKFEERLAAQPLTDEDLDVLAELGI